MHEYGSTTLRQTATGPKSILAWGARKITQDASKFAWPYLTVALGQASRSIRTAAKRYSCIGPSGPQVQPKLHRAVRRQANLKKKDNALPRHSIRDRPHRVKSAQSVVARTMPYHSLQVVH